MVADRFDRSLQRRRSNPAVSPAPRTVTPHPFPARRCLCGPGLVPENLVVRPQFLHDHMLPIPRLVLWPSHPMLLSRRLRQAIDPSTQSAPPSLHAVHTALPTVPTVLHTIHAVHSLPTQSIPSVAPSASARWRLLPVVGFLCSCPLPQHSHPLRFVFALRARAHRRNSPFPPRPPSLHIHTGPGGVLLDRKSVV